MEPQVGSILEGKVTSITKFGAFVTLEGGRSGLVHISEIANTFVNDVRDFLQEGQPVKVLVLSTENGKINLSIKKAQPRPEPRPAAPRPPRPAGPASRPADAAPRPFARAAQQPLPPSGDQAFEDKLKQFLSSSEGKMADLNRSMDGKRGGRRRR
jgi:S1 RNA binding domain protein